MSQIRLLNIYTELWSTTVNLVYINIDRLIKCGFHIPRQMPALKWTVNINIDNNASCNHGKIIIPLRLSDCHEWTACYLPESYYIQELEDTHHP